MIVRRAELSDIPAVAALERAEFPDGADEGMLTRLWETDGGVILAAGEGDALLGYVWARFVLDEGEIGNITVAPEHRRCGVDDGLFGYSFCCRHYAHLNNHYILLITIRYCMPLCGLCQAQKNSTPHTRARRCHPSNPVCSAAQTR